jgi:hypothetical protein
MKRIFTLLLLSFFSVSLVSAQVLLTEDFNYTAGSLTTNSGGAWTNIRGSIPIQVVDGNLTYTGYSNMTTGGMVALDSVKGESAFVAFAKQSAGTIYYSFLLNVKGTNNLKGGNDANGEYFISLLPNQGNDTVFAAVTIRKAGKKAGFFNLGIISRVSGTTPGTIGWTTSTYSINTTYLVTVGYKFVAGTGNNKVGLWVNPSTSAPQIAADVETTDADAGTEQIRKVGLFQNSTRTPASNIDALKVSQTWDDIILPINLLSFNVIDNAGFASLSWQTCNESNVKTFEVQKSADARSFLAIGNVAARNGACGTTYSYRDAKELAGTAFYRLRVVDNDGKQFYSAIVSVSGKIPTKVSVFPNPVVNNLVLSHPKATDDAVIKIVSMNGSLVASYKVQKDAVQTSVDVSKLAKGNYIVIFHNAQQSQKIKILKQ